MSAVVVIADFYQDISAGLLKSCRAELTAAGLECDIRTVPGALEIPSALHMLARQSPSLMVALGCVIRGDTYHFEIVAHTCAHGILQVQLQTGIAIGNGVLTVNDKTQALARLDKGGRAARAALALARLAGRP